MLAPALLLPIVTVASADAHRPDSPARQSSAPAGPARPERNALMLLGISLPLQQDMLLRSRWHSQPADPEWTRSVRQQLSAIDPGTAGVDCRASVCRIDLPAGQLRDPGALPRLQAALGSANRLHAPMTAAERVWLERDLPGGCADGRPDQSMSRLDTLQSGSTQSSQSVPTNSADASSSAASCHRNQAVDGPAMRPKSPIGSR